MIIEEETREVHAGDAVYIPSNMKHGIRNLGDGVLEYLTVNSPMFEEQYESYLWPADPAIDKLGSNKGIQTDVGCPSAPLMPGVG